MTEPNDPTPPSLDVHQNGSTGPVASIDAITTLIHSFASMITSMEARITARINENASASKERWSRWEAEFKEYRERTDQRIEKLEAARRLEERKDLVAEARIAPVRTGVTLLAHNWKNVLIIIFAVVGALGLATDLWKDVARLLGI
jgi:hypothetical protein